MSKKPTAEMTEAVKFDDNKPRYDLLPWPALEQVAMVMAFGAKKYAEHNWAKGMAWTRLARATIGHVALWLRGEDNDPESGFSHLAHAGASVLMLLSLVIMRRGNDSRFKDLGAARDWWAVRSRQLKKTKKTKKQ